MLPAQGKKTWTTDIYFDWWFFAQLIIYSQMTPHLINQPPYWFLRSCCICPMLTIKAKMDSNHTARKNVCPFSFSEVISIFSITYVHPNHAIIDILAIRLNLEAPVWSSCCKLPNQTGSGSAWWENNIPCFYCHVMIKICLINHSCSEHIMVGIPAPSLNKKRYQLLHHF